MSVDRYGNNKIVDESKCYPGVRATSRAEILSGKKDESGFSNHMLNEGALFNLHFFSGFAKL